MPDLFKVGLLPSADILLGMLIEFLKKEINISKKGQCVKPGHSALVDSIKTGIHLFCQGQLRKQEYCL